VLQLAKLQSVNIQLRRLCYYVSVMYTDVNKTIWDRLFSCIFPNHTINSFTNCHV